jgi:hypothetical protein
MFVLSRCVIYIKDDGPVGRFQILCKLYQLIQSVLSQNVEIRNEIVTEFVCLFPICRGSRSMIGEYLSLGEPHMHLICALCHLLTRTTDVVVMTTAQCACAHVFNQGELTTGEE